MHIKSHIYKTCEDLEILILENPHTFQVLTYRYSVLLYASAPDLDQLSALEAQLKQGKELTINTRINLTSYF